MFIGRNEFGEEHREFVSYAFIAFFIGIVIIVVGTSIMVTGSLSGASSAAGYQKRTINYSHQTREMIIGLIVVQFGGLVFLIGEILLVFKLENKLGREILYLALAAGIVIAILSSILYFYALNNITLLSLVTSILLLSAYYIPLERIKRGELKPVLTPSTAYKAPMYPPQYPHQSYSPKYPYPPPPPQVDPDAVEVKPLPPPPPPLPPPPPPPPEE
jgi:hypothetical protein